MPTDDTPKTPPDDTPETPPDEADSGETHDHTGERDSLIPDYRGHDQPAHHGDGHDHGDGHEHGDGHDHGDHSHTHMPGHSHGPSFDGPPPDDWWGQFKRVVLEWYHGLKHSMFEAHAFENIEKEAEDIEDAFLFACFADAFGIPSPVSYYTVELLPYLTVEFEQWERRMWDRDTLLERKGEQYHFH